MMRISNLVRKTVLSAVLVAMPAASFAGVFVSVTIAPPALPVYTQPICPGDGYLWNPGYWAYGPEGYYWVPGVWVRPPQLGCSGPGLLGLGRWRLHLPCRILGAACRLLWRRELWVWLWGVGFVGGRWEGGHFAYNTAVVNVNRTVIHNVYRIVR